MQDAGQMAHARHFMLRFDMGDDVDRFITAAAAGAVRAGHEIRFERGHIADRRKKGFIAFVRLGWEVLKGDGGLLLLKNIGYLLHNFPSWIILLMSYHRIATQNIQ